VNPAHDSLLYAGVETVLAGEITDGDLKVGDQLPTEDSLIALFGVSRITVRRAIQNLVSRGLVDIPLRANKRSGRCSHGLTEPDMRRIAVQPWLPSHQEIKRTQLSRCFYEA
jgi:DNA-binding FadR family transcriptional regulator